MNLVGRSTLKQVTLHPSAWHVGVLHSVGEMNKGPYPEPTYVYISGSQWGDFVPRDIWQCLETLVVVASELGSRRGLLASGGQGCC